MRVIIAEKPSVARNVATALGSAQKKDGYIECPGAYVTWCYGHLVELAAPEAYSEEHAKWSLDTLPILPEVYRTEVKDDGKAQFEAIAKLVSRKDVDEVVCATDADREGELIFRYVMEEIGCTKPCLRLWTSSQEPDAIRAAMKALKPDSDYDGLSDAAHGRSQADWAVGMNLTRLYSVMYGPVLPCGRVQTPVVAELVRREDAIANFKPTDYWNVVARFDGWSAKRRFDDKGEAEAALGKISGASARIVKVEQKAKKEAPPLLYSLTALQKDAATLLGLSAEETLAAAQSLYEKRLATYPRTDSRHITSDLVPDAKAALSAVLKASLAWIPEDGGGLADVSILVDDAKVESHPALLPTASVSAKAVEALGKNERAVLSLISWQLVCALCKPHAYRSTSVVLEIDGLEYTARGKEVLEDGWRAADAAKRKAAGAKAKAEEGDERLPALEEGSSHAVVSADLEEKQTKGPSHHTETSLLEFMETAGKEIDDAGLREIMRGRGIGTSATRASTIAAVIERGYAKRVGKKVLPTFKARALVETCTPALLEPETTARWEAQLSDVEKGELSLSEFMAGIEAFVRETCKDTTPRPAAVELIAKATSRKVVGACPRCKAPVVEKANSWECSSNRYRNEDGEFSLEEGCGLLIPKKVAKKKLPEGAVKQLLERGKTGTVKGFVSKAGTKFDAKLKLTENGVEFLFEDAKNGSSATRRKAGPLRKGGKK